MRSYLTFIVLFFVCVQSLYGQTTEFTFQGSLNIGTAPGTPANTPHDFEFRLFNAESGGTQLGSTLQRLNVPVTNGNFSVRLDFGSEFTGATRYIEISVRATGSGGGFQQLLPRQTVSNTPYAVRSLNAANADTATSATNAVNATTATNALNLGGVAANQFVLTTDPRMTDARPPTPGSSNYVQNSTAQFPGDFNLIGSGAVTSNFAAGQYNIGPNRMLSIFDTNLFVGRESGRPTLPGLRNSFFGYFTGPAIDTGVENTLVGFQAGNSVVAGNRNAFFGKDAGRLSQGNENTFLGANTAAGDVGGNQNTLLGFSANLSSGSLTNATAIGARAAVSASNSIVLGSINGVNGATADTNVGIGILSPTERLHVVGNGLFTGSLTVSGTLNGTVTNATNAVNATNATNATTAANALNLGGVAAAQFVQTNDARLSDARNPLPNSPNYIQNGTGLQAASNFNISGNGTAGGTLTGNIVSASTQFNIGANRILANTGGENLFAGAGAGVSNGAGIENAFFGRFSGEDNTTGSGNSFFGFGSGRNIIGGTNNSFFGSRVGLLGTTGDFNSFFGHRTGENNTGSVNSFFGTGTGLLNTSGNSNSFFGHDAGNANSTGSFNTTIGENSDVGSGNLTNATAIGSKALVSQSNSLVLGSINGTNGATADTNVGIGTTAPAQRLHVVGNGLFTGNLTVNGTLNATLPAGSPDYIRNSAAVQSASFNISGFGYIGNNLGVGTTTPSFKLHVIDPSSNGLRVQSNIAGGYVASFGGVGEFGVDAPGVPAGRFRITENGNVGIGATFSDSRLTVSGSGIVRSSINSDSNAGLRLNLNNFAKWSIAAVDPGQFQIYNEAIGSNALWIDPVSNAVGIGSTNPSARLEVASNLPSGLIVTSTFPGGTVAGFGHIGEFLIASSTNVGGRLRVEENSTVSINAPPPVGTLITNQTQRLVVNGVIRSGLGGAGVAPLCHNPVQEMSVCVSSIRFKENVRDFRPALDLIRRLRPVSFTWNNGGGDDLGLIAEEVAKVEPLLATYETNGLVQGVKYDRIGVVAVNAINEQQTQIEAQAKQIDELREQNRKLQAQVNALTRFICRSEPTAEICKEEK